MTICLEKEDCRSLVASSLAHDERQVLAATGITNLGRGAGHAHAGYLMIADLQCIFCVSFGT